MLCVPPYFIRREQKYQQKLAAKKAARRAAESASDKLERKKKAKMDNTAEHFGSVGKSVTKRFFVFFAHDFFISIQVGRVALHCSEF